MKKCSSLLLLFFLLPAQPLLIAPTNNQALSDASVDLTGHTSHNEGSIRALLFSSSLATTILDEDNELLSGDSNFTLNLNLISPPLSSNFVLLISSNTNGTVLSNTRSLLRWVKPQLISHKNWSIEAPLSGGYPLNGDDLVPGSILTTSILLSNTGEVDITNISIEEELSEPFYYLNQSANGFDEIFFLDKTNISINPSGIADFRVNSIHFSLFSLPVGSNTTIVYKTVLP